jgi:hypothetical protein
MKLQSEAQQLVTSWTERLRAAGLQSPELLSATYDPAHFGNAEATFRVGSILVRVVRDRGQELLNVASSQTPAQFHLIEDVEIAMGWKTIDDVLARQEPEQLDIALSRLAQRFDQLATGWSGEQERLTRARIERARRERRQAFMDRLRGKK